jgi:hypothetical protein
MLVPVQCVIIEEMLVPVQCVIIEEMLVPVQCVIIEEMLVLWGGVFRSVGGGDTQYHQHWPVTDHATCKAYQLHNPSSFSHEFQHLYMVLMNYRLGKYCLLFFRKVTLSLAIRSVK